MTDLQRSRVCHANWRLRQLVASLSAPIDRNRAVGIREMLSARRAARAARGRARAAPRSPRPARAARAAGRAPRGGGARRRSARRPPCLYRLSDVLLNVTTPARCPARAPPQSRRGPTGCAMMLIVPLWAGVGPAAHGATACARRHRARPACRAVLAQVLACRGSVGRPCALLIYTQLYTQLSHSGCPPGARPLQHDQAVRRGPRARARPSTGSRRSLPPAPAISALGSLELSTRVVCVSRPLVVVTARRERTGARARALGACRERARP